MPNYIEELNARKYNRNTGDQQGTGLAEQHNRYFNDLARNAFTKTGLSQALSVLAREHNGAVMNVTQENREGIIEWRSMTLSWKIHEAYISAYIYDRPQEIAKGKTIPVVLFSDGTLGIFSKNGAIEPGDEYNPPITALLKDYPVIVETVPIQYKSTVRATFLRPDEWQDSDVLSAELENAVNNPLKWVKQTTVPRPDPPVNQLP